jgi:hypothetical protein
MSLGQKNFLQLLVLIASLHISSAQAQDKPGTKEREALRRSQQQVQQMRQEKSALEEKLALVEKENGNFREERAKLVSQAGISQKANS